MSTKSELILRATIVSKEIELNQELIEGQDKFKIAAASALYVFSDIARLPEREYLPAGSFIYCILREMIINHGREATQAYINELINLIT